MHIHCFYCNQILAELALRNTVKTRHYFEAKCANDEVIIVNKATFGTSKIGKCISESLAFFMEFSVNVLNFMESQCSGRGACSMPVALLILKGFKNCTLQLASYLEVDYSCIRDDLNLIKFCN